MKLLSILLASFVCVSLSAQQILYINSNDHLQKGYPFSQATLVNNIIYLSGELGTTSDGTLVEGGIVPETIQALKNISETLEYMGSSIDNVFKCTCMLADIKDWPQMSKAYKSFFKPERLPARSAFAGSGLALNARIELECWAVLKD